MESSRIFVRGIPPNISEVDFRKHFSGGRINDIKLMPERRLAFIGYNSPDEARDAVKHFNRSFIRMSKISVELARPVNDPELVKTKQKRLENRKANSVASTAEPGQFGTRKKPKKDDSSKSNKRKREEGDESDPKLREFLSVMKSEKEEVAPPSSQVAADAAESDNEYEEVPKHREKKIKVQEKSVGTSRDKALSGEVLLEDTSRTDGAQTTHVEEDDPETDKPALAAAMATTNGTDDEWLRLRTNRLLDLVDPDDAVPNARTPNAAPTKVAMTPSAHQGEEVEEDDALNSDREQNEDSQSKEALPMHDSVQGSIKKTRRLFLRNLAYTTSESDLRDHFEKYGELEEVYLPSKSSSNKGFAFLQYIDPEAASRAFQDDGITFQGRLLHILPASAKRDGTLDEFALSKLPLKQQNLLRKKAEASKSKFSWNSLFMSQDAVNTSVAERLGVSKSELLDPTNADAGVKQALAETSVIQDVKAYFLANGVDLNSFKYSERGDTSILVKNFHGRIDEIRTLFEEHGKVLRVLMPPAGTIAIVQFADASEANRAFSKLAYRRFKNTVLYLEKGPKNLFVIDEKKAPLKVQEPVPEQRLSSSDLLGRSTGEDSVGTSSVYVSNLNFSTTTDQLAEAFQHLDGFKSARVATKKDSKRPGETLSQGFGFVEFTDKASADAAVAAMNNKPLHAHKLQVRASHRGADAAEERRQQDRAKKLASQKTKVVVKNLPFTATKDDIRKLLGNYGQVRSVRVPKSHGRSRGFGFVEFVTPAEAASTIEALQNTHLLGRRLVLQYSDADAIDPEAEIERQLAKVGGQANKVALAQLTRGDRKKITLGEDDDEGE